MNFKTLQNHSKKVDALSSNLKQLKREGKALVLEYSRRNSNTTRNKNYKKEATTLNFGQFNEIMGIDLKKQTVLAEPRVTMKALLDFTLSYGWIPAIVPEFKGITVGGAIMGGAAESTSHQWGCFHNACLSYELIDGNGELIKASRDENSDLFDGIAGSYGSIAALVLAEIQLLPAQKDVFLKYHTFSEPLKAIEKIQSLVHSAHAPQFLDGLIFSNDFAVIIEGNLKPFENEEGKCPHFSMKLPFSPWYYQHVKEKGKTAEIWLEKMSMDEYLFRYDLGAFWMGAYLFNYVFLKGFTIEGWLGYERKDKLNLEKMTAFDLPKDPGLIGRTIFRPLLHSQHLWSLLHQSHRWVQNLSVIQDFCIPESLAKHFCTQILIDPCVFPIWLCPIKSTERPQIFAPNLQTSKCSDRHFINFGLYGIPKVGHSIPAITKKLEGFARSLGGRKVLYSDSYYTEKEFWEIYARKPYEELRKKTHASRVWHEITQKVISF